MGLLSRILAGLLWGAVLLAAQAPFALTIDNVMRGPGLVGYEPVDVRWSGDSQRIYFRWKQASDPIRLPRDTYVVGRDGSGLRKLTEEEAKLAPPVNPKRTRDQRRAVYALDGDVFLYDYSTDTRRQITKTSEPETNPHFTQNEARVAFTRANNLYTVSLESGTLEQWTNITSAPAPDTKTTPSQDVLKKQERDLLEIVRDRALNREEDEARKKRNDPRQPFRLESGQTLTELWLCPSEKCVAAVVSEGGKGSKNDNIPVFVTESSFTEEIPGRNNVGDLQDRQKVALLDTASGAVTWVEPPVKDRDVEMLAPSWDDAGTHAMVLARAMDNKDRWILALDAAAGKAKVLYTEHDDAWTKNFGDQGDVAGWAKDRFYFNGERTGFLHLYSIGADGGEPSPLTSGKFEILDAVLSRDQSHFYITTNESTPYEQHLWSVTAQGGARTQISKAPGKHQAVISPDEKWIADVASFMTRPPELFVMENRPQADAKKLTTSPSPDYFSYAWKEVPIVEVPARDGVKVPARIYKPANFQPGGPAVIFVHGAGYLQNVHRWWSQYAPNYLFHHFLMERGYLVLDIDYRGSAGYGRDWRTAIYRHMGGKDLDDQVDAARWLVSQHGVAVNRIGIYGGSYGGFITLMALFTAPDVFAAGAALRPVTDWSHYNHGYTSNILNTPQGDPEAYKLSSPIFFAEGLKSPLLICHGMVDTNVFFQDTVRLTQKLIELRKERWSVAMYPVEDHGFVQPSSWADEYKRIFRLFEDNLKK